MKNGPRCLCCNAWLQTAVGEATVQDGGQGQAVEAGHQCVVETQVVLVLAFMLEVEIRCEMPTFVVAPQHVHRLGVMDFESQAR